MKILNNDNIPYFAVLSAENWLGDSTGKSAYLMFLDVVFVSCMLNMKKVVK